MLAVVHLDVIERADFGLLDIDQVKGHLNSLAPPRRDAPDTEAVGGIRIGKSRTAYSTTFSPELVETSPWWDMK